MSIYYLRIISSDINGPKQYLIFQREEGLNDDMTDGRQDLEYFEAKTCRHPFVLVSTKTAASRTLTRQKESWETSPPARACCYHSSARDNNIPYIFIYEPVSGRRGPTVLWGEICPNFIQCCGGLRFHAPCPRVLLTAIYSCTSPPPCPSTRPCVAIIIGRQTHI